MNRYGLIAISATELIRKGRASAPREAWDMAARAAAMPE